MSIRQKSGFSPLPGRDAFAACQAAGTFFRPFHGRRIFSCCARGCAICAPHFFFLVRKKKRVAPGVKKKEHGAALRCLGLLRIDGLLITERSAIWKFFRMRSTTSAAAAKLVINSQATENVLFFTIRFVQQISFCPRNGSGKRKQTHPKDVPKRKQKAIKYFG